MKTTATLLTLASSITAGAVSAQCRPVTGCERPEFAPVDQAVLDVMCANAIPGATLAIAYDGVVVYERGYGWSDQFGTTPMQPDALLRLASVSKPLTVAAVRSLIADGAFTLDDFAFDLGQPGGGLLELEPFPSLGDTRLAGVRIRHLIEHTAGWDRGIAGDLTYREILVAGDMSVASPPGRERTLRWILGQPLQFAPGTNTAYSNIGGLALGLIVEQFTSLPLDEAIQQRVLDPIGIHDDDHAAGRTFEADHDPREPWYQGSGFATNVFDANGPAVWTPYGSWDHEARIGQGGQIATASALARAAAYQWVNGPSIGLPKSPTLRGGWRWNHTGVLEGTGALIRQRGDGITYVVLFNSRGFGGTIRNALDPVFDSISPFPVSPCCPADTNGDGALTPADFNGWILAFNTGAPECDQNADGQCTPADFSAWILNFNEGC